MTEGESGRDVYGSASRKRRHPRRVSRERQNRPDLRGSGGPLIQPGRNFEVAGALALQASINTGMEWKFRKI